MGSLRSNDGRIRDLLSVWDVLMVAQPRCYRFGESLRLSAAIAVIESELDRAIQGQAYKDTNWIVEPWVNGRVRVRRR